MSTTSTMTALEAALARLDAPSARRQADVFKPVTRAQADAARAFLASGERFETATLNASGEVIRTAPAYRFGGVSEALKIAAE